MLAPLGKEKGEEKCLDLLCCFVQQRRFHMGTVHLLGGSSFPVAQRHV